MIVKTSKNATRTKVHTRIRKKIAGTTERPRLSVSAGTIEKGKGQKGDKRPTGGNVASAKEIGKLIAERAKEKGIKQVVFDRGGYLYHGRIKALADAAREAGLEF